MEEVRGIRQAQDETLAILRSGSPSAPPTEGPTATRPQPVRRRGRRTALLIDDDEEAREAARAALESAEVVVRTAPDGSSAIEAIAAGKPDVIVLEPDLKGAVEGRDLINMIKATMEWIDIPIVAYTRLEVRDREEALAQHGADDLVGKGPGAPQALVSQVVRIFRR